MWITLNSQSKKKKVAEGKERKGPVNNNKKKLHFYRHWGLAAGFYGVKRLFCSPFEKVWQKRTQNRKLPVDSFLPFISAGRPAALLFFNTDRNAAAIQNQLLWARHHQSGVVCCYSSIKNKITRRKGGTSRLKRILLKINWSTTNECDWAGQCNAIGLRIKKNIGPRSDQINQSKVSWLAFKSNGINCQKKWQRQNWRKGQQPGPSNFGSFNSFLTVVVRGRLNLEFRMRNKI